MFTTQDIITAIENHTTLLRCVHTEPAGLKDRFQSLVGMLELARRLPVEPALIAFLEQHRDRLWNRWAQAVAAHEGPL
jgi:hypothetical protein